MKTVNDTGVGTILLLVSIPIFMFIVIPYGAIFSLNVRNYTDVSSVNVAHVDMIEAMIWVLCITLGIVGLVFTLIYSSRKKKAKKNQLIQEKEQFVQNSWCPELMLLPPDYRYALACSYILSCFQNMRADTMKEAVNLYVEQLDRWKQESLLKNMQNQMAQIQREQASSNAFFETAAYIGLMKR